jgi:HEAT repeat protein
MLTCLGQVGLPYLRKLFIQDNLGMRGTLVQSLWHKPHPACVELLIEALSDQDSEVREAAAGALTGLKKEAQPALQALLENLNYSNDGVRSHVINALGAIGDWHAFEALLPLLADSSESNYIQLCAAHALARTGGRRALEPLFGALESADRELASNIFSALQTICDEREVERLNALLRRGKFYSEVMGLLSQMGQAGIKPLVEVFQSEFRQRFGATTALGRIGKPAMGILLGLAQSNPDPKARVCALIGLQEITTPELVPALIALLKDPNAEIRQWAGYALGKFPQAEVTAALHTALIDENGEVRSAALDSLSQIEGENLFELALQYAEDAYPQVRIMAYRILRRSGRQAALPLLQKARKYDEGVNEFGTKAAWGADRAWRQLRAKLRQSKNNG